MLTATEEAELRAIVSLTRCCERSHGAKQTAMLFSALADRLESFVEEYGEAAWRRRTGQQLPLIAARSAQ